MNNPFQLNFNQYQSQFAPLPVEDIMSVAEGFNKDYLQGVQQADALKDQILAIQVAEADQAEKNRITQDALSKIDQFSKNGNFEDAPIQAIGIARSLKDNKFLNSAVYRYAGIQNDLEELRKVDASDAQMEGFRQHLEKYGQTPTTPNKFGEYDKYVQFDAFKEPDIEKEIYQRMKDRKAQKTSEFVEDGEKIYIINHSRVSESDLFNEAKSYVMNNPKAQRLFKWETDMNMRALSPEQKAAMVKSGILDAESAYAKEGERFNMLARMGGENKNPYYTEMKLTPEVKQHETLVKKYFGKFGDEIVDQALKVMQAESGGKNVVRDASLNPGGGNDKGVFQINDKYHPDAKDTLNIEKNIAYAAKLFEKEGWKPWYGARAIGLWGDNGKGYSQEDVIKYKRTGEDIEQLRKLSSTPEGIESISRQMIEDNLMQQKFGSLANNFAEDSMTYSNLRLKKTPTPKAGSREAFVASLDPTTPVNYTAAGDNASTAFPNGEQPYDRPGRLKDWVNTTKETFVEAKNNVKSKITDMGVLPTLASPAIAIALGQVEAIKSIPKLIKGYIDKREKSAEEVKRMADYETSIKSWMNGPEKEMIQEVANTMHIALPDFNAVPMKKIVTDVVQNNQDIPAAFIPMDKDQVKLLGVQEGATGIPLQENSYFALMSDKTTGGGDYSNTKGLPDVMNTIAKQLGKKSGEIDFVNWEKRGFSPANPQGMPGAIVYNVQVVDKKSNIPLGDFNILKSNSNRFVSQRFGPLQEMAKFAYSGVVGKQVFGNNLMVVNIPTQGMDNKYRMGSFIVDSEGNTTSFDQYMATEGYNLFNK